MVIYSTYKLRDSAGLQFNITSASSMKANVAPSPSDFAQSWTSGKFSFVLLFLFGRSSVLKTPGDFSAAECLIILIAE